MSWRFEIFWSALTVKAKAQELGNSFTLDAMDSPVRSNASDTSSIQSDLESNASSCDSKTVLLVRLWRVPMPVRKGCVVSDLFKNLAILMTLICIAELVWIQRLRSGLMRVANDPYDIRFGTDVNHQSPEIWNADRQTFIRDAYPVPVHSHNDYWRRIPLFEALGSGCISIEADVHLEDDELYVAHTSLAMHTSNAMTLQDMYLDPLRRMLDDRNANSTDGQWNGIYNRAPGQTVVLLVDFKSDGTETFDILDEKLQQLRDRGFLSFWDGKKRVSRPLTIVATGNAPFESILKMNSTHRDIFFDAPLDRLISINDDFNVSPPIYTYNASNSHFASTRWHLARLWAWRDPALPEPKTPWEKDFWSSQLEQAEARGLVTRYWDTPNSPPNLVDIVWRVLVERKVGLINMDDLGAVRARARGWGRIEL